MEKLSSDIVQEILTRLSKPKSKTDINSILQCRKVCSLWRSLLGKPKTGTLFCSSFPFKLYYGDQLRDMVNFDCSGSQRNFYNTVTKIGSIDMTSMYFFCLVGSCNGLVCYKVCDSQDRTYVYVFNPITGEWIRLLDLDVSYADYCMGFGYCNSTNAYKVFSIRLGTFKQGVQVYTLGDGRGWRDIKEFTYPTNCYFQRSGVFANGALHWLIKISNGIGRISHIDIVAFDVTDETFRSLPLPPIQNYSVLCNNTNIGSLEGNLYLCLRYFEHGDQDMMDIWMFKNKKMNDCQQSCHINEQTTFTSSTWIKVFSGKGVPSSKCQLLSLTESEILLWEDGGLSCHDRTTYKKVWYATGYPLGCADAISHMNSLVSLKDLGEELVDREDEC